MTLGYIRIEEYLERTAGKVCGRQLSDAKDRYYDAGYDWQPAADDYIWISRTTGSSGPVKLPKIIPLDESLISFFGLYSGDGAKGSEDPKNPGRLRTSISFSQREPNLVRFAVRQFRIIFSDAVRFVFSLGEDSALFMDGPYLALLTQHYGGVLPETPPLATVLPALKAADERYLQENRHYQEEAPADLAFYYAHKRAMEEILVAVKQRDLEEAGVELGPEDRVVASIRRPFKKGAREPGGSSRSDEMHVGGVSGLGELFLKMMHEIEDSILNDTQISSQGLITWIGKPSEIGRTLEIKEFFLTNEYGKLNGERPTFEQPKQTFFTAAGAELLTGKWPRSKKIKLHKAFLLDPLFCYTSGLYLAEGTTPKSKLFAMFQEHVSGLGLGFTSSENTSLELMLRALSAIFPAEDCVSTWKVKVGSQYFPELVVIGLKNGVPMLRGGNSGDGKMRTMEISISIKDWALNVAPALLPYDHQYSHVEPTGAGVARIDFSASSALCKWYFPLVMYATFGEIIDNPAEEFTNG